MEQLTRPLLALLELVTGLESTYLTRIDEAAGIQDVLFARNSKTMQIPEGLSVPWGDTLCKRALDEARAFTDNVSDCWGDSVAAGALGIQSYISVPVKMEDGSLFGTLCGASAERKTVEAQGQYVLSLFATLIARQIQREDLLDRLQKANALLETYSYTDTLTGLPNRRAVMAEIAHLFGVAQRTERRVSLLFIDLDGFKQINDTHGHDIGDSFLVEVGRRLSSGLRSGDMLGRLGGDEFVVAGLMAPLDGSHDAGTEALRNRLAPLLEGAFDLGGCRFDYGGASFGAVCVDPFTSSPEAALKAADAAMYAEKQARRRGCLESERIAV